MKGGDILGGIGRASIQGSDSREGPEAGVLENKEVVVPGVGLVVDDEGVWDEGIDGYLTVFVDDLLRRLHLVVIKTGRRLQMPISVTDRPVSATQTLLVVVQGVHI
jgi:hypothetical protein